MGVSIFENCASELSVKQRRAVTTFDKILHENIIMEMMNTSSIAFPAKFSNGDLYEWIELVRELEELGYTNMNFHNIFRNINNSIKNKLPKENKEYNTIIKEIFRKK